MVNRADLDAVARATADRYLAIEQEWFDADNLREIALTEADHQRQRQDRLSEEAQRCYATAALFGFDLQTTVKERAARPSMPRPRDFDMPLPAPQKVPTVKEFVLKAAQDAFPNRVRASELRKALLDQLKMEVHEKTVGMTLYRLLKDGKVSRNGIDWFFNPNQGAAPSSDERETQREIDELLR